MVKITKQIWDENDVELIVDKNGGSWLNEKHIETKTGHSNLPGVTNKYDPMHKKCRFELLYKPKYKPCRIFMRNDLAEKLVKPLKTDKIDPFRRNLKLNVIDVFNTK